MAEYMLTTDEVRRMFATAPLGGEPVQPVPMLEREFDRWLAQMKADTLREVAGLKADAWDEGYFQRMRDYPDGPERRDNPYREEDRRG